MNKHLYTWRVSLGFGASERVKAISHFIQINLLSLGHTFRGI